MKNRKKVREPQTEVWMNRLGRLLAWQVSKPDLAFQMKRSLRKSGYQRLGTL